MSSKKKNKILASVSADRFIGRTKELDQLLRYAKGRGEPYGMTVLATPGVGLTELLTQTYDQLFYEQGDLIPFYFQIKRSDKTSAGLANRFLQSFIQQIVAFRRAKPSILDAHPDVCEIAEIAIPADGHWIDRLIETCEQRSRLNDEAAMIRNALSAPLRALAHGARAFVMIDDFENADLPGAVDLVEELKEIYSRSKIPFVFSGKRRFVFGATQRGRKILDNVQGLELRELDFSESGLLAESLSSQYNLNITDQTRDLMGRQFCGNPSLIRALFQTAYETNTDLDTFRKVEEVYASALFGGKIKGIYDSVFDEISSDVEVQKQLIDLLYNLYQTDAKRDSIDSWKKHVDLDSDEFYSAVNRLNISEFIRETSNMVEVMSENDVIRDYIETRFRLENSGDSRSLVVAESLSAFLKRAPDNMAKFYKRSSALGMREIMVVFDCQKIPSSLCDYGEFKASHKGREESEIFASIESEAKTLSLPQIIYTAHTVSLYSPISKLTDKERSAVALGFEAADYKDENEIVWIAAEVDSKLEANAETTSFWCDRLEMVALMCDFTRYRLWLVAAEGFSPEAIEILRKRNAMGSSRAQVELLAKFLGAEDVISKPPISNEYEMVLPMGDDTELIAAYAVEEIAKRHSFEPKAINQIKTALVEACINATEHSNSPDRKIYQKFAVEDDKIVITISNRGLRFKGKETKEIKPVKGRRGWGLKLMQSLMDDVSFEQVDDGTRISMTKMLAPHE